MVETLLEQKESILKKLKENKEFHQFYHIVKKLDNKILFRDHLYSGVWSDYYAGLVDGVTWDLELVLSGLNKLNLEHNSGMIADICCGDGRLTRYLHQNGFQTGGVDYSTDQINKAMFLNSDLVDNESWKIANVLDKNTLFDACKNWDILAAVTSAASINCFGTKEQLRMFFRNIKEVLGSLGCQYLLLPVFADESEEHFEKTFRGDILGNAFKSNNQDILAWVSLLYNKDEKTLLQPSLAANVDVNGNLFYEFCYSTDRIWTNTEVEKVATEEGIKMKFSLPSNVVSGGADQWPFTLMVFEF